MNFIKTVDVPLSLHFSVAEFNCPCKECILTVVDLDIIPKLEALRTLLGTKLTITSGYRCRAYQEALRLRGYETALGVSQHELGRAADVSNGVSLGHELEDAAHKAGFKAVGVGSNWVHVDLRDDKDRRWSYAK